MEKELKELGASRHAPSSYVTIIFSTLMFMVDHELASEDALWIQVKPRETLLASMAAALDASYSVSDRESMEIRNILSKPMFNYKTLAQTDEDGSRLIFTIRSWVLYTMLHKDLCKLIIDATRSNSKPALKVILKPKGVDFDPTKAKDEEGKGLLIIGVMTNNYPLVKAALKRNADVTVVDKNQWSALHHAVTQQAFKETAKKKAEGIELITLLLDSGANINGITDRRSTALHLAYANNLPDIVELLIARGANKDAVNVEGKKPTDYTLVIRK
jgi:hypothetical protein